MNNYYDVAIIGSGFSGSLLAYALSSHGKRVVLIDDRAHPRFSIGESSTPIADLLLEKLANDFSLEPLRTLSRYGSWIEGKPELDCGKKRGFSYFRHTQNQPYIDDGRHLNSMLVTASVDDQKADTHWLRADVDEYFYQLAIGAGTDFFASKILRVRFSGGVWKLEAGGEISASFLVDAGGRTGALSACLKTTDETDRLQTNTRSTYGHFSGIDSWQKWLETHDCETKDYPFNSDDAAQHHLLENGWLWMLRFRSGRTSVGWTRPFRAEQDDHESHSSHFLDQLGIARYPSLYQLFAGAELADPPGGLRTTGRLQRLAGQIAGEHFALMPTAAGVIDPLHSSGIAHGLSGVYRLASILLDESIPIRRAGLRRYEAIVRRELLMMDRLVAGCYAADQSYELFKTHCLFYFLAAIECEERIVQQPDLPALWSADNAVLYSKTEQSLERIKAFPIAGGARIDEYVGWAREQLAPHDSVGLTDLDARNIYHYTVAPK